MQPSDPLHPAQTTDEEFQAWLNDWNPEDTPRNVLDSQEIFWRDHQVWLQQSGYMLRPRYHPNWVPSGDEYDFSALREDLVRVSDHGLIDAKRISDGEFVMLKRIFKSAHPYEAEISTYFSTEPLASHPRNHCVPIFEVLEPPDAPDLQILVILLLRENDDPRFETVGELVEFLRQIFEGLQFMHQCHVAHRDCMSLNIMMEPRGLFPNIYHPQSKRMNLQYTGRAKHTTRTAHPVKYYLIDFGISRKFNPADGPPRELPIYGGDKSAPELHGCEVPIDPFPTDIYYLGNLIREDILAKTRGAEFLTSLMQSMVQRDPSKRPTIDEVVIQFDKLLRSLWWWQLRARLKQVEEDDIIGLGAWRSLKHIVHTAGHLLAFRSAIPKPRS